MEYLGALALYFLFKFLHKLWEERDQDNGERDHHLLEAEGQWHDLQVLRTHQALHDRELHPGHRMGLRSAAEVLLQKVLRKGLSDHPHCDTITMSRETDREEQTYEQRMAAVHPHG